MDRRILPLAALLASGCQLFYSCFVASTRVATPRGRRRIGDVREGDPIWAWDVARGVPVARTIARVRVAGRSDILRIAAGELVIPGVTPEHPFWDPVARTWVPAGTLRAGHPVLAWLPGAEARRVAVTEVATTPGEVEVFDLTVAGEEHDFFAEGILVHNKKEADWDTAPDPPCDGVDFDQDGWCEDEDCDDHDSSIHPGASEWCNGIDDNCNGIIDGGIPIEDCWD